MSSRKAESRSVAELLAVITDPVNPAPQWPSCDEFRALHRREEFTVEETLAVLGAIESGLTMERLGGGAMEAEDFLIPAVVGTNPVVECAPVLERLATTLPEKSRGRVVAGLIQVACRNNDVTVMRAALDLVDQSTEDGVGLIGFTHPLQMIGPGCGLSEVVLPALTRLGRHRSLRRYLEEIRESYAAAGLTIESADPPTSFMTPDHIRSLARDDRDELVSTTADSAWRAMTRSAEPSEHEKLAELPVVLRVAWSANWLECEVENGGLDQYLDNAEADPHPDAVQLRAVDGVAALEVLGLHEHAEVLRGAVEVREASGRRARKLPSIDDLNERFWAIQRERPIHEMLADYLIDQLDELSEALRASS